MILVNIDWDEFKEFKKHSHLDNNFDITLSFLKNYYNVMSPFDVYDVLSFDPLGKMMLEKRDIKTPEDLEPYLFKARN